MIRPHMVALILRTIREPLSDADYISVLTASREELMAALPDQSSTWYDKILEDDAERLARANDGSSRAIQRRQDGGG
jgi:hypothetical protein